MEDLPRVPFGHLVVEAGLASREQIAECLDEVRARRDQGQDSSLGQVLLERGLLTRQEILRILKSQNKTLLQCPSCGRQYNIVDHQDGTEYRCPHDNDLLVMRLSDVGVAEEIGTRHELGPEGEVIAPRSDTDLAPTASPAADKSSMSSSAFRVDHGYIEGIKDLEPTDEERSEAHATTVEEETGATETAPPPTLAEQYGLAPGEQIIGRIGDFVLTRVLGRGGMGDVYLGRNRMITGLFAIKILSAEKAKNPQYRERFLREARLANRLDHPNVVKVWDVGAIEGYFFIVMEYIDGETMAERVTRTGPMPVPLAVSMSIQSLRGIEAAHHAGIIHRDLKPANVMMRRDGLVKVFDFGLALPTDPGQKKLTLQGQTFGTPHFMSPEQIYNRPVDERTDLYSLGASLFHALTADYPYPGEKAMDVLMKRMNEKPVPILQYRSDLPDGLVDVIERLMADDPGDRYENAYAARKALEPWAVS